MANFAQPNLESTSGTLPKEAPNSTALHDEAYKGPSATAGGAGSEKMNNAKISELNKEMSSISNTDLAGIFVSMAPKDFSAFQTGLAPTELKTIWGGLAHKKNLEGFDVAAALAKLPKQDLIAAADKIPSGDLAPALSGFIEHHRFPDGEHLPQKNNRLEEFAALGLTGLVGAGMTMLPIYSQRYLKARRAASTVAAAEGVDGVGLAAESRDLVAATEAGGKIAPELAALGDAVKIVAEIPK